MYIIIHVAIQNVSAGTCTQRRNTSALSTIIPHRVAHNNTIALCLLAVSPSCVSKTLDPLDSLIFERSQCPAVTCSCFVNDKCTRVPHASRMRKCGGRYPEMGETFWHHSRNPAHNNGNRSRQSAVAATGMVRARLLNA